MAPGYIHDELQRIGYKLSFWQAEIRGILWLSAFTAGFWLFALTDLYLRFERIGRVLTWSLLLLAILAGLYQIWVAMTKKRTPEAIAARIENTFPNLDNHLINFIQFETRTPKDPMVSAYVERGIPEWGLVNPAHLKNRRNEWRAILALAISFLLMIAAAVWVGPAWTNSLLRIINPFSPRPPTTLAHIVSIEPGDSAVVKGTPVILLCKVNGKKGQPIYLDMWPADDKKSVLHLGKMRGIGTENYSFRIPKVSTALQYRFRAGDAVSPRHSIQALPPLAFTKMEVTVTPPDYTRFQSRKWDGLVDNIQIPQGSKIGVSLQCNRALASASIAMPEFQPVAMNSTDKGLTWAVAFTVESEKPVTIAVADPVNCKAENSLKMQIIPDKPPNIRILAPTARTVLASGSAPNIQFEVDDDYGLTRVILEQLQSESSRKAEGQVIKEWTLSGTNTFAGQWTDSKISFGVNPTVSYRVAAYDNCAAKEPHRSQSSLIIFDRKSVKDIEKKEQEAAAKAAGSLAEILELQKKNLDATTKMNQVLETTQPAQWKETADVQRKIRIIAGRLIAHPQKPLGGMADTMRQLYNDAMADVIEVMERVSPSEKDEKSKLSQRAIMLETRILKLLSQVETNVDKAQPKRAVTGLLALIEALVKGQEVTLETTKTSIGKSVEKALVEKQDRLAGDLGTFVQTCKAEASKLQINEPEFSQLILKVADGCESQKVGPNMLKAAEQLEKNAPDKAVPSQTEALKTLKEFLELMNQWRVKDAEKSMTDFKEALDEAQAKFDKLIKVQSKIAEAAREAERQPDKSNKKTDELAEEAGEMTANTQEALLQVATDLQIFPELPVGNDLVNDVFQIYEEAKQLEGSATNAASELGLQKEDFYLEIAEAMKNTKKRLDDMEMWLVSTPDATKRNTEDFDKQEMPKIPIIPMPGEMEDIIGDLLEQEEKEKDKADDSATNQGTPDMAAGWGIAEGETVNYSAKGKSGNERPDHKEQDGRSNVGRQGMSDGETAAGGGKINQGDDNIEKRMTQDSSQSGAVQEDGHAKAVATGGGKNSGYGDQQGMAGSGPRRDSKIRQGSELGWQALLRRNAQALYARATLSHVRTGSLDEAIRYMRQAEDAIGQGMPIQQVREYQKRAVVALKQTQTELNASVHTTNVDTDDSLNPGVEDQLAGVSDEAPTNYRELVSDYFKALSTVP